MYDKSLNLIGRIWFFFKHLTDQIRAHCESLAVVAA